MNNSVLKAGSKVPFRPRLDIADRNLLIPGEVVEQRIAELGVLLNDIMRAEKNPVVLAGVLTGGVHFLMDLKRHLEPQQYRYGFLHTSRYAGNESGGRVTFKNSTLGNVSGHTVILVDDIGDGRRTLEYLVGLMKLEGAAKVMTCVMLNKPVRKEAEVPLDLVGFNIPNVFVWGRGLDGGNASQCTRNDDDICHFGEHPAGPSYEIPKSFPC